MPGRIVSTVTGTAKRHGMARRLTNAANAFLITMLIATGIGVVSLPASAFASGRSGGGGGGGTPGVDTIKVSKAYFAVTPPYVELLINAGSSDPTAHLYAYLPNGQLLGEVQNGGGGRYGGTVFVTMSIPETITILSTAGGATTVLTVPFQF